MAHLSEVVDGGGHHIDAAGAAGGGTEGRAQGGAQRGAQGGAEAPVQTGDTDQGQGVPAGQPQAIQPPPCLPGFLHISTTFKITQSSPFLRK